MMTIGIVGWSGVGKTTLIEGMLRILTADGLDVATIKHAHRRFDMDRPGKDSHRHRDAGARQVLVTSPDRWALLTELRGETPPDLSAALARLDPCDLVLVEGYRGSDIDKIEVWRPDHGGAPLWATDARIVAVATDVAADRLPAPLGGRALLALNDVMAAAAFVRERMARCAPALAGERSAS